jgi:hypothetical protein
MCREGPIGLAARWATIVKVSAMRCPDSLNHADNIPKARARNRSAGWTTYRWDVAGATGGKAPMDAGPPVGNSVVPRGVS